MFPAYFCEAVYRGRINVAVPHASPAGYDIETSRDQKLVRPGFEPETSCARNLLARGQANSVRQT